MKIKLRLQLAFHNIVGHFFAGSCQLIGMDELSCLIHEMTIPSETVEVIEGGKRVQKEIKRHHPLD